MNGCTCRTLPCAALMTTYAMKPKPMPFVIEYVNGMTTIMSAAGRPIATSWKSIPASFCRTAPGSAMSSPSVSELSMR